MQPGRQLALVQDRPDRTGGAERWLAQLASWLVEHGHQVTIVCRQHGAPPHPDVRFVRLPVHAPGGIPRALAFGRAVARHVAEAHYDVVVGLGRSWTHDVARRGGCHRRWRALEREHLRSPLSRIVGRGRLKGFVGERLEHRALHAARRVLVCSGLLARDLEHCHGVPRERIDIVHNGVDLERFHPRLRERAGPALRRELELDPEAPLLLFAGAGFDRKGLGPLLEAMPAVLAAHPEATLLVAGRDRREAAFLRRAQALGLGARVRFLGFRSDVETLFAAADLHVLPTLYDGFGYSVLEALACGVPVITTENAGAAELLERGIHGEVLPAPTPPAVLAEALAAWADRARIAAAREAVRKRAEEHPVERSMREAARVVLGAARSN